MVVVQDKTGNKHRFDGEEVIKAIMKAGGSKDLGDDVLSRLGSKLNRTASITTSDLKKKVYEILVEINKTIAEEYKKL